MIPFLKRRAYRYIFPYTLIFLIMFTILLSGFWSQRAEGSSPLEFVSTVGAVNCSLAIDSKGLVWIWGEPGTGVDSPWAVQRTVPEQVPGLSKIKMLAAGVNHYIALKDDGTMWTWGSNDDLKLGEYQIITTFRALPKQVRGLTDVIYVAAGAEHSMAVKRDGTVWGWGGFNQYGRLGNHRAGHDESEKSTIFQVEGPDGKGFLTNVIAVAAGYKSTAALKKDGSVWIWGDGDYGVEDYHMYPRQVKGLSNVKAIVAGNIHYLALKTDGTVWAWGANSFGQLGNGTNLASDIPMQVKSSNGTGFLNNITEVKAGQFFSIALSSDGTVYSWGFNQDGQLGDGSNTDKTIPVPVKSDIYGPSLLRGIKHIGSGLNHSLVIKHDGTIWGWGINTYGALGDGTTVNRIFPVKVKDPITDLEIKNRRIRVRINGSLQYYDQPPEFINGRTMVPIGPIFQALGAHIQWDDKTKTVVAVKGNVKIELTAGKTDAKVNNLVVKLEQPAQIINGRTMVPIRFVADALNCRVEWDAKNKTVYISNTII